MKTEPSRIYAREMIERIESLSDAGLIEWKVAETATTVRGIILDCCQAKFDKYLIRTMIKVGKTEHHWFWGDSLETAFALEIKKELKEGTSTVIITSDSFILPGQEIRESSYLEDLVWQVSKIVNRKEKSIEILKNDLERLTSALINGIKYTGDFFD